MTTLELRALELMVSTIDFAWQKNYDYRANTGFVSLMNGKIVAMKTIQHAVIALAVTAMGLLLMAGTPAQGAEGLITNLSVSGESVSLLFGTAPGRSYQVQQISNTPARWWNDKGTAIVASATAIESHITNSSSCVFFRVLEFTNSVFWYDWGYLYEAQYLSSWGLGAVEESYYHQDRPYEWYIDQADTGAASGANCGPSSVTMAIKWYDQSFTNTAEDARDWSYSWRSNGWWYTSDIINYLNLYSIPNTTSSYTDENQLQGLISEGKLVILCIDTGYITQNLNSVARIDRFYAYADGHFLVVKGARTVSGSILLEVYDPNNWHAAYTDGTPKGRNRHFKGSELTQAIQTWWDNIIVVDAPPGGGGGEASAEGGGGISRPKAKPRASKWLHPVNPATIKHARGR
jgi:hypothetical protein